MIRCKLSKMRDVLLCVILTFLSAGMALYPAEVSCAVRDSVMRCLNILIPSLFAFMAISSMLIKSGSAALIARPFVLLSRYIFHMPESIFTVFLISIFAGYPVGIKTLSDMLENGDIDPSTAEKAACFCYCGGPAFYSGAVGLAVFGNKKVGLLIFLSVFLSDLLLAFIVCRFSELKDIKRSYRPPKESFIIGGITSAGKSMGLICMTVIFFSAVTAVLEACGAKDAIERFLGLSDNESVILSSFIEITSLSELKGAPYKLLPLICAACSFGGVCIIIQLFALKSDKISLFRFLELRPFAAVLAAVLCKILQPHIIDEAVSAVSLNRSLFKVNNFAASICLILMIFLLNYKKSLVFSD